MANMTTIRLYGAEMRRLFPKENNRLLESSTVSEAMSALCATLDGFEKYMREAERRGIRFAIFRGERNLSEEELGMRGQGMIRVVPIVVGSKREGLFQTILGAALIAVGTFFGGPGGTALSASLSSGLISGGAALALGGVIQMLSPQPKGLKSRQDPANTPSYAFGGPVNTIAQGNPVGILYGRRRIGGAIISAGIYAEDQM